MMQVHKYLLANGPLLVCGLMALLVGLGPISGCITIETGFDSPAPSKRLDAIVEASTLEDDESLLKLVEKLRSYDDVERMFAIRSLELRTGETLGYHHADPHWERIEALGRWIEYLDGQGIETSAFMDEGMDDEENDENQPMEQEALVEEN